MQQQSETGAKTGGAHSERCETIRVVTRSLGLLIPLTAVCAGVFFVPEIRDILVGGIIGVMGTASIFYYED